MGGDEQQSWEDGDVLGETGEGREEEVEEAGVGDIPLRALSLLLSYHPLLSTALPTVRQRSPLSSQRGNLSILPT